jgi:hypothetical protein
VNDCLDGSKKKVEEEEWVNISNSRWKVFRKDAGVTNNLVYEKSYMICSFHRV